MPFAVPLPLHLVSTIATVHDANVAGTALLARVDTLPTSSSVTTSTEERVERHIRRAMLTENREAKVGRNVDEAKGELFSCHHHRKIIAHEISDCNNYFLDFTPR